MPREQGGACGWIVLTAACFDSGQLLLLGPRRASTFTVFTTVGFNLPTAEDLEALLGARPYRSAELRNIDKFTQGFGGKGKAAEADAAVSLRASDAWFIGR